jgi:dTDP-4-dehydrorhamnose 3,5-epimerase
MNLQRVTLEGFWLIELEPGRDERRLLARTYREREFAEYGLNTRWPQCNHMLTHRRSLIRGLHHQDEPSPESKLVCCQAVTKGELITDVRSNSFTHGKWEGFELSGETLRGLYAPESFAQSFRYLPDECKFSCQMSNFYPADLQHDQRWNGLSEPIRWPVLPAVFSDRGRNLPLAVGP